MSISLAASSAPSCSRRVTRSKHHFSDIASAAATPPRGKLSGFFGRKPTLSAAIAVPVTGFDMDVLSGNMETLIAGRLI